MEELSFSLGFYIVLVYVFLVMFFKYFKGFFFFVIDILKDFYCVNVIFINYGDEFIES